MNVNLFSNNSHGTHLWLFDLSAQLPSNLTELDKGKQTLERIFCFLYVSPFGSSIIIRTHYKFGASFPRLGLFVPRR